MKNFIFCAVRSLRKSSFRGIHLENEPVVATYAGTISVVKIDFLQHTQQNTHVICVGGLSFCCLTRLILGVMSF